MKLKKSRSVLTHTQQNGIFLFVGVILVVLIGIAFYHHQYPKNISQDNIVDTLLQNKLDSLKLLKTREQQEFKSKIYPFNPNFLKEGKAYRLGISAEEHQRLLRYRKQGEWINSAEDFQKVTKVSDEKLKQISKYFKFPDWVLEQKKSQRSKPKENRLLNFEQKKDLNTVTEEDLIKVNGIGEILSNRIIRYREKIGGFRSDIQLQDVYGLKPDLIDKLTSQITVKTDLNLPLIDINNASLIELAEIPYFDYELARDVFQFIKVNQGIDDFEELSKIQQFPSYKIDRIKLYLAINK